MEKKKNNQQKGDKKYLFAAAALALVIVAVLAIFAIAGNGGKKEEEQSQTAVAEATALTCSRLTSSLGPDISAGETTALTAFPKGGTKPYLYKFIIYNPSTDGWFILQDYSDEGTYYWTPTAAGNRTVYVDVKDNAGHQVRHQIDLSVN